MPRSKVPKKRLFREFSPQDKKYLRRNYLKKLKVVKHFVTPSQTYEDHLFREETKMNYRVRYALTQKARLLVQKVYREFESK